MSTESICTVQVERSAPGGIVVLTVEFVSRAGEWVMIGALDFDGQDVVLTSTEALLAQCLANAGATTG